MKDNFYNNQWIAIDSNKIHITAIIYPNVILGKNNIIGPYCVIGSNGEIRNVKQGDFKGNVIIGDNNVISEFVSIQRPYNQESTIIGDNNIIMAHSHIGHDVKIGSNCEICTGTIIGGYVTIEDNVKVKLGVTIRNRIKVAIGALIGLGSSVVKDVKENTIVYGNPAKEK
jgi:acyl-[acyl carrier protein]--UDP-N-acetylglucosamine O-acyltransferase